MKTSHWFVLVWVFANLIALPLTFAEEQTSYSSSIKQENIKASVWAKITPMDGAKPIQIREQQSNNIGLTKTSAPLVMMSALWYMILIISMIFLLSAKRGQMEIMGLVLIVVLILISLLFVLRFFLLADQSDIKNEYRQMQMASNMLSAILRTKTQNCSSLTVQEIIQDCAESDSDSNRQHKCQEDGNFTCDYLNNTIIDLFNRTVSSWGNQSYDIKICNVDTDSISLKCQGGGAITNYVSSIGGCDDNFQSVDSKQQIIPLSDYQSKVMVQLRLCSKKSII